MLNETYIIKHYFSHKNVIFSKQNSMQCIGYYPVYLVPHFAVTP